MAGRPHIKGVRIRTVNMIMLLLSLILFGVVLYTTIQISGEYKKSVQATEEYINWEKAAHTLHVGSDYLTEQARLYTQTRDKQYADNYFRELYSNRSREHALELFDKNNADAAYKTELRNALDLSNALTHREIYAIRLVADATGVNLDDFPKVVSGVRVRPNERTLSPDKKVEEARDIMFNRAYAQTKGEIMDALNKFLDQNLTRARTLQMAQSAKLGDVLREQRIVLIALCLLNILTFAMIIVLIVKPLQIYLKCIRNDQMFSLVGAYEFKHLALTYNDIFAMKEHQDKILKHKAEHDPLTGLMNRRAFDSLSQLLKASSDPVCLLLVDVDKFKHINDTYGHVTGDKILCKVADLLKNAFRADDFCIRMGGDEFAVVIKGISPQLEESIREKVETINKTLTNPDDGLPEESISVGVAFSREGFSADLYNNADQALYVVKEKGRRGCAFYNDLSELEKNIVQTSD